MNSSVRISSRVLMVMHGYEPPEWAQAACQAASMWVQPTIRILALLDVPAPPMTSLTPMARRAYREALETRRVAEQARMQAMIERTMSLLPGAVEVIHVPVFGVGRLASTIAEYAQLFSADVVVIAPPVPGFRTWLWPGAIHRDLLRHAPCAVMQHASLSGRV